MKHGIKSWMTEIGMSQAAYACMAVVLTAISSLCLAGLLICAIRKKRKCRTVLEEPPHMADCPITQKLSVADVQTDRRSLSILTDIVYCESEEVIL